MWNFRSWILVILSIFTPKFEKLISVYTEGITNLGESLTPIFLFLEVRFEIVLHTGKSVKRADLNYVILVYVEGTEVPEISIWK